jgi:signal transduction histidine kinase
MPTHPKVPATSANCEEDHEAKLKLNQEFEEFKAVVENAAKISPDVQKLKVPLKKLENALIIAAHGKHLVAVEDEKKQRS